MRLYDFSLYARRRQAAKAVAEVSGDMNRAGSVVELKEHVKVWLKLHSEIMHKRAKA
jgi:hypothetical protein